MVSEKSLVKNIRTRCLGRGWLLSCFFTKWWAWQHSRPRPLHIAPPAFPRSCKDHQDIGVKDVSAPHTCGSAHSETLKRKENQCALDCLRKLFFLQNLLHGVCFYLWGGAPGIERGELEVLLLLLPLSLGVFIELILKWISQVFRYAQLVLFCTYGRVWIFLPINISHYVCASIIVSNDSAIEKSELVPLFVLWICSIFSLSSYCCN